MQAQKPPPVQKKLVQEAPQVQHDDVHDSGGPIDRQDDAAQDQEIQHTEDGNAVPGKEAGGAEVHVPAEQGLGVRADDERDAGQARPRRSPKPNPKYSPEVYDLSYVGVRKRSRKSIRRADS